MPNNTTSTKSTKSTPRYYIQNLIYQNQPNPQNTPNQPKCFSKTAQILNFHQTRPYLLESELPMLESTKSTKYSESNHEPCKIIVLFVTNYFDLRFLIFKFFLRFLFSVFFTFFTFTYFYVFVFYVFCRIKKT